MTFEEILDHAIARLQRRGRLTYGTLKRPFQLDDAALDNLKDALLYASPEVHDDVGLGAEGRLRMCGEGAPLRIDLSEHGGDQRHGAHAALLSWAGCHVPSMEEA
jgi:hypothetical protein